MRTFLVTVALGIGSCSSALSQAGTNHTPKAEDFRICGGKLYNVKLSTNWFELGKEGQNHRVTTVFDEGLLIEEYWRDPIYGQPDVDPLTRIGGTAGDRVASRPIIAWKERPGQVILLRNHSAKKGAAIGRLYVTQVGSTNWLGEKIPVYDCGLPNTPENRKLLKD